MALTLTLKSGKVVFRSAKERPFAERKATKWVPSGYRLSARLCNLFWCSTSRETASTHSIAEPQNDRTPPREQIVTISNSLGGVSRDTQIDFMQTVRHPPSSERAMT